MDFLNEDQNFGMIWPIFDFELKGKGHEPNQAKTNVSVRAHCDAAIHYRTLLCILGLCAYF